MTINKENIDRIINMILEEEQVKFDMSYYFTRDGTEDDNWCGTAACIAGYCADATIGLNSALEREYDAYNIGKEMLGLTEHQADTLFLPSSTIIDDITKTDAITVLENLRDTGRVEWSAAVYDDFFDQDEEYEEE